MDPVTTNEIAATRRRYPSNLVNFHSFTSSEEGRTEVKNFVDEGVEMESGGPVEQTVRYDPET